MLGVSVGVAADEELVLVVVGAEEALDAGVLGAEDPGATVPDTDACDHDDADPEAAGPDDADPDDADPDEADTGAIFLLGGGAGSLPAGGFLRGRPLPLFTGGVISYLQIY